MASPGSGAGHMTSRLGFGDITSTEPGDDPWKVMTGTGAAKHQETCDEGKHDRKNGAVEDLEK